MPINPVSTVLYENYLMHAKDGRVMCTCSKKKRDWYVSRGLAQIDSTNPQKFHLLFDAQGPGQSHSFYLTPQANKCVCCGGTSSLTKHHLVPHCYRQHMPVELKASPSYDVLPLCTDCHSKYETHAFEKKQDLAKEFPVQKEAVKMDASRLLLALKQHHSKMKPDRIELLLSRIEKVTGTPITLQEALSLCPVEPEKATVQDPLSARRIVTHKISSGHLRDFIVDWRLHFLSTMKPEHMPQEWNPYYFDPRHEHTFNKSKHTSSPEIS
jgi:exonuclease 3'-5' domain-containing protein 2